MNESDADERALKAFAQQFRLKVRLDECGDPSIPGRRGQSQLYFAGGELCLMVIDGPPAQLSSWRELGGKLWRGDISPHPKTGKRVQDVKITGIPMGNAKLAIKMARIRPKQIRSDVQREANAKSLAKAQEARRLKLAGRPGQSHG